MQFQNVKKMFHWGPMLALLTIKLITWTTMFCLSAWFPFGSSIWASLNTAVFLFVAACTLYNYLSAIVIGPGVLPCGWKPANIEDQKNLQYCRICDGFKAPRSHHCRSCGKCILKMDHHCPWINNCVGHYNHFNFAAFLSLAICGSAQAFVVNSLTIWKHIKRGSDTLPIFMSSLPFTFCVLSIGLSVGVVLALSFLLFVQAKCILSNATIIEKWIITKSEELREYDPTLAEFVYPYHLGWWENFKQVYNAHKTNGSTWKVADGCGQYDLTSEQLRQKKLKRMRSIPYKVLYPYSGSLFPISYGLCTCLHPPFSIEKRLPLQANNIVIVTRFYKYWYFGEKETSFLCRKLSLQETSCKEISKGWFPKSSVAPITSMADYNNGTNCDDEDKKSH